MHSFTHAAIVPLAGGFSLGASTVLNVPPTAIFSFKPFYGNDRLYLQYLKQKDLSVPYYQIDDESFDVNAIKEQYSENIDIVHGIPPCSGLSQAASRKAGSRGTCEVNNWMYLSAEFALSVLKPKVFLFENAPGLYTGSGEEVRKRLLTIAEMHEYAITFYKTNTIKHGIPQYRPRTFAIFCKGSNAPILNTYSKEAPNIVEYLNEIPTEATLQDAYINDEWDISNFEITKYLKLLYGNQWREELLNFRPHITTYDYLKRKGLLNSFLEFQQALPDRTETVTKNVKHIIKNAAEGRNARINYRVLGLDKNCVYAVIGEMMGRQVHPVEDRLISIREFMHLMGLPHDYQIDSPKDYVKLTQNVPTKTCSDMIVEACEIIKGNRSFYKDRMYMQDNLNETNTSNLKLNALF
jgi:site-specific DNA-cytosine methylase